MKDPIRFLDDASEANEFERAVLGAEFVPPPSRAIEDRVFAQILATAALAPAVVTAEHGFAVKAASTVKTTIALSVAKGFVVGLALYGTVSGAPKAVEYFSAHTEHTWLRSVPEGTHANAPARRIIPEPENAFSVESVSAPASSGSSDSSVHLPANAIVVPLAPSTAPPVHSPAIAAFDDERETSITPPSRLTAEVRALREARAALRAGELERARSSLKESEALDSSPTLYQEREALMIELLYRSGHVREAVRRARTFLDRFPESPHAARVQSFSASP